MKKKKLLLLTALAALLCPVAAVLAQRHAQAADASPRHLQQGIEVDWEPAPEPEPAIQNLPKTYSAPDQYCLDSIRYWIGTGSKRAGLVLHMDEVRVIGFRFDGEATGMDMLVAVAREDPRFQFATNMGAILMMGWDTNENGVMGLCADGQRPGTESPIPGVINWGSYDLGNIHPLEEEDYCWGGWMGNYWRYSTMDPDKPMGMSNVGAGGRKLQDGSWDEWVGQGLRGDGTCFSSTSPSTSPNCRRSSTTAASITRPSANPI